MTGKGDLIKSITLSDGERIPIYMPTTGEYLDLVAAGRSPTEAMVLAATKMTYQKFRDLPITDGSHIMQTVTDAVEAIQKYNGSGGMRK